MKRFLVLSCLIVLLPVGVLASERPEEAIEIAQQVEKAFEYVAETVRPAVVTVLSKRKPANHPAFPFGMPGEAPDQFNNPESPLDDFLRRFFERQPGQGRPGQSLQGLGSGMIVRSDGHILTNHHVVKNASEIKVRLHDGETLSAAVVGSDSKTDLAVLKVDRSDLPTVTFADSDKVRAGQYAIAIGSPFQMENSVSVGHVSAKNRSVNVQEIEDLIQTDAAINQGNSGGPLVNINGEVIGVNTLIISQGMGSQGVGFAIASNLAQRTVRDIVRYGDVKRPWLGVVVQELTADMKEHFDVERGVIVSDVVKGSPAHSTQIKPGDVIVALNDSPITSPGELQRKVLGYEVDETVQVTLRRGGDEMVESVTLAERGQQQDQTQSLSHQERLQTRYGLKVRSAGRDMLQDGAIPTPALQVTGVRKLSPAARAGLKPGDIILKADGERVTKPSDLVKTLQAAKKKKRASILLHVKRDQSLFMTLPIVSG